MEMPYQDFAKQIKAAVAAERERCARIADIIGNDYGSRSDAHTVAATIRAITDD